MLYVRQVTLSVFLCCMMAALARPDGGDSPPLPGPGLSYGTSVRGGCTSCTAPTLALALHWQCTTYNRRGHSCLRMDSQRIRNISPKATKNNRGIPYGSMSGNVAEFFRQQAAPSGRSAYRQQFTNTANVDFAPIEQWLR